MIRYLFDTEGLMTPIENVHQHPDNDNNGDIDEIVQSMQVTGVYRPIYAAKATGNIVAGNHTYLALLELGAKFVPVIWLDINEAAELRVLEADNFIARLARRDDSQTVKNLQRLAELEDQSIEEALRGTGIDERKWLDLLKEPTPLDFGRLNPPGGETLEHRITCPECGHNWKRGSDGL